MESLARTAERIIGDIFKERHIKTDNLTRQEKFQLFIKMVERMPTPRHIIFDVLKTVAAMVLQAEQQLPL